MNDAGSIAAAWCHITNHPATSSANAVQELIVGDHGGDGVDRATPNDHPAHGLTSGSCLVAQIGLSEKGKERHADTSASSPQVEAPTFDGSVYSDSGVIS